MDIEHKVAAINNTHGRYHLIETTTGYALLDVTDAPVLTAEEVTELFATEREGFLESAVDLLNDDMRREGGTIRKTGSGYELRRNGETRMMSEEDLIAYAREHDAISATDPFFLIDA